MTTETRDTTAAVRHDDAETRTVTAARVELAYGRFGPAAS
jgi:hypothetical protein